MRLILASASPRRAELLRAAGYAFETTSVDIDEGVRAHEAPEPYVRRLAEEKSARAIAALGRPFDAVLAADTAVVVDGAVLGKPIDDDDSRRMLRLLSGRDHLVLTGISVRSSTAELSAVDATTVTFARLSADEIEWYVASGEGRDKAGSYAIQGLASRFIPRIAGSYSNVVGLPVARVAELLTEIRYVPETRG